MSPHEDAVLRSILDHEYDQIPLDGQKQNPEIDLDTDFARHTTDSEGLLSVVASGKKKAVRVEQ